MVAYLKAVGGPEAGQIWEVQAPKCVLGRHPDCDISVDHLDVSRHHAQLVFVNHEPFLEDLRSRNGTFLNDERIHARRRLCAGDRIRISETVFEFSQRDSPDIPPASPAVRLDQQRASQVLSVADRRPDPTQVAERSAASIQAELRALLEITQDLRSTLSLDRLLPQVLETLFRIFPSAARGFIVLRGDDGTMVPRWTKFRPGQNQGEISISSRTVARAMESQQALLSADSAYDVCLRGSQTLDAEPIRSVMCAPMVDGAGNAFGVLQVDTAEQRDRFTEDDLRVLMAVATQAAIAIDNARLHEKALYQQSIERDLELADQIQRGLMPACPPHLVGYEFFDYYRPASYVGGDFYDYVTLPDGRMAIVVADVVGHGLAAAMLVAKLAAEIRYCLLTAPRPLEVVTRLNASLSRGLATHHFVTLVLVVLDPATGDLTIVNAGHMPPILRWHEGRADDVGQKESALPLGVMEDTVYRECAIQIPRGGMLLLYTDGVNEAMNPEKQVYGMNRVRQEMRRAVGGPRQLGQQLVDDVRAFVRGSRQADDMCLVCLGRA